MPSWATWKDVPLGEQLQLLAIKDAWEQASGYQYLVDTDVALLAMARDGVSTMAEMGKYMNTHTDGSIITRMPWAAYGLGRDQYQSLATTFGAEYKKVTGHDISAEALSKAFQSSQTGAGGLLTGSEYGQQLISDPEIQKTYGWVKYGLDYNQFQQQKLGMQQSFGQVLDDTQAIAQLTYFHASQGSDRSVHAQAAQGGQQKQATPGEGQSEIR